MQMINKISAIIIALISLAACSKPALEIENAYVPIRSSSQMHFAAYFDITNNTPDAVTLESVTSKQFKSASLHESKIESGVSKMRPLATLDIAAKSSAVFEPNGKHVMLMQAKQDIWQLETINLEFIFSDGTIITHTVPLRKSNHNIT